MTVTGIEPGKDRIVLTAMVSGDFPGSPFPFNYHLTLKDGLIAALKINA